MKSKLYLTAICSLFLGGVFSQQIPTGAPGSNNNSYWSKGGNNGSAGSGNIFGTQWNSPIYFITAGLTQGTYRARLNGTFTNIINQYQVNNYSFQATGTNGINTSGYLGLGFNMQGIWSQNGAGSAAGPYSVLHLNGRDGTFVQNGGFRPWMKTGVTFTDNNDLSYMGLRKVGPTFDKTETTIAWSDNAQGASGPDDMVFRFTSSSAGSLVVSQDLTEPADFDGLHVARFTGTGNFGLGHTFGINVPGQAGVIYATPRSLAHLSTSVNDHVWMQFTNRRLASGAGGTGEQAGDGLRIGVLGNNLDQLNGNALIYQQEDRHLLFSTNANTNSVSAVNTSERMRLTSIGAQTELANNGYGVYNPGGLSPNLTRVSISHNPNNPVTRPLSLMHLGYNTGNILGSNTTDGWRSWMDVGMIVVQQSDNIYIGLKPEGVDQQDAVISWGDNQVPGIIPNGPDHLRFIFTSTQSSVFGAGDPVSTSQDGLETMRIVPFRDTLGTYGRVGIGDFTAQGLNQEPTHKLDVDGNGRFRKLPDPIYQADASVTKYVMVDADGVLRWQDTLIQNPPFDTSYLDCITSELVFVFNTDSTFIDMSCLVDTNSTSTGGGFVPCGDLTGIANLTADSKANLNDFNLYLEDGADSLTQLQNKVGLGYDCSEIHPGKFSVDNKSEHNGIYVLTENLSDQGNWGFEPISALTAISRTNVDNSVAAKIVADGNGGLNLGVNLQAINGQNNIGMIVLAGTSGIPSNSTTGIRTAAVDGTFANSAFSGGASGPAGSTNYGAFVGASGAGDVYGVYSTAGGTGAVNYAGYFVGDVTVTGTFLNPSDQNLKQNIQALSNDSAAYYIDMLNPSTFEFQTNNFPQLNLSEGHQYGMIAQEVEQILPSLTADVVSPAQYDSLGNLISPSLTYKGLNYEAFIPLLIADAQNSHGLIDSLETTITTQDSVITDLNTRLTSLENCLSNILPFLCQLNNSAIQENSSKTQETLRTILNVELSDNQNIVLDQNVPNPFAEQTIITYSIPEAVKKAQIHFYNASGALIKVVDINERGPGQLNVFGSDLSTGIYTYTLVADDQIVATKKMQKMNF